MFSVVCVILFTGSEGSGDPWSGEGSGGRGGGGGESGSPWSEGMSGGPHSKGLGLSEEGAVRWFMGSRGGDQVKGVKWYMVGAGGVQAHGGPCNPEALRRNRDGGHGRYCFLMLVGGCLVLTCFYRKPPPSRTKFLQGCGEYSSQGRTRIPRRGRRQPVIFLTLPNNLLQFMALYIICSAGSSSFGEKSVFSLCSTFWI